MQLTEAESSFRALKSELSIRPLFHQLEPCVKAHVMVAFLGYALWVTLKHLLKRHPHSGQKSLLRQLGVNLPEHLQFNRECNVHSATA
jgi:transposase